MNDVIVLCYHALSPDWEADLSTTPERFERQIALLAGRGYRGVTFTQAALSSGDGRVVAVTFDDAFRSVIELARPILDAHGFLATVFAPTDFVGSGAPLCWDGIYQWLGGTHEHELAPMSWDELRSLAEAGWEIGSHTGCHPRLTQTDDTTLEAELARSKATCEQRLERPCESLAYPYGDLDARVVRAAARAGYVAAGALPQRLDASCVLAYPRIGVYRVDDDSRFRLKVSPAVRRLRRSRAWDPLRALATTVRR